MARFPRPKLAQELADAMLGESMFGDAHNGLFLAAPRRTGKSTFLQGDLVPELHGRGVVTVYVDLWADQKRDPGALIAEAIGKALQPHLGVVAKAAKNAGVESVGVAGWLKIDTSKIGKLDGATLPEALRALHETSRKPVALLIDEAQHALTSTEGENAMAALKSARDQLNTPDRISLMLLMSGSDRDKLLRLVNSPAAPFYGSSIHHLQELDRNFIAFIANLIEGQRGDLVPVAQDKLFEAFRLFGNRPQFFLDAIGRVLSPVAAVAGRFEDAVLVAAREQQGEDGAQMASEYRALRPVEQAVLWRMLQQSQRFRPYDAEALRFYSDKTGSSVSAQQAQNALEALRQRSPALVWKSSRGEYAVEDAAMHRWYDQRLQAKNWPPGDVQVDLFG